MAALSYRVSYQDYRGWREKDVKQVHPSIQQEVFAFEAAAVTRKDELKRLGFTVCMTTVATPRAKPKVKQTRLEVNGERFNARWRIAK